MATIGLFSSYAPPGVYTRTLLDRAAVNLLGGIRIPVLVGPTDEVRTVYDEELFRGSSATADNPVYNEDTSTQLDGTVRTFTVARFPIVTGQGTGTTTNSPNDVEVTIDRETTAGYFTRLFHLSFHAEPDIALALIAGRERIYLTHFYRNCYNPGAFTHEDIDEYVAAFS